MDVLSNIGRFLSTSFISPVAFAFLGLIPVVILLYLLKLRRTEIVISSTMLWMKSLEDLTANAPFQKLRKNLLMFLQILILLLIIIAMARPFVRTEGVSGTNICLIIDRSASMQTIEDGKTRLDTAREKALEMIDELRGGDKMMVVAFAEKADVLHELTDDKYRLRRAVNSILPSDTRTNIRDVILIARSLAPDNPDVPSVVGDLRLVLLSDGKISDLDELGALAVDMSFLQIGETSENAGIVAFSVRNPVKQKSRRHCFVRVRNEHATSLQTVLSLHLDDELLAVKEIEVPAGEEREYIFEMGDLRSGILRVEIEHEDALPLDNMAWLAVRPPSTIKVLLVGDGESMGAYFLKRVFSLDARVELSAVNPANYADTGGFDLTIFDNFSPAQLPRGTSMFVNNLPSLPGLASIGTINNPPILGWDSRHLLMRFLNPEKIVISEALKLRLPDGAKTILSTTGGPLIADVSYSGRQVLIVAFDIAESDWPLHLSFPLFVQNLLEWLPKASMSGEASVVSGRPLTIMPNPQIKYAHVETPDGSKQRVELDPMRPVYFGSTDKIGVYRVARGSDIEEYAVNLLDKNESDIAPAPTLKIGRGEVVAERGRVKQNRELWRWFILATLMVLGFEWWIYSRRAWM